VNAGNTSSRPPLDPTATWDRPLRVQFVHGLESGPGSSKAAYLAKHFDAVAIGMDTSSFEASVAAQAEQVRARPPDVLVGSSFGGAVTLALLQRGIFSGPSVLLAPAYRHFHVEERIPDRLRVLIVHGRKDTVVPVEDSRALSKTGTPGRVELVEVDDEHRLPTLLEGDRLASLVRRSFLLGAPPDTVRPPR
jgi:predicted esterase